MKNILLGITGGIAAYKSASFARLLIKSGYDVRVIMTASAQAFITPLTLQALTGNPVHIDLLDESAELGMGHIELAKWADLLIIAPATANTIAKLAMGIADDLLTTVCLATAAPILVAPAMNQQKGEMVLVVAGASDLQNHDNQHDELLKRLLQDLSVKKAAQLASDITGAKKNALYDRALRLQRIVE